MSGSATLTVGSTLRYAEDDGSTVELLVEGQWLSGGIKELDGDGVILATEGYSTLVRLAAISVVRVYAAGRAPLVTTPPTHETQVAADPTPIAAEAVDEDADDTRPVADGSQPDDAQPDDALPVDEDDEVEKLWLLHERVEPTPVPEVGDVTEWYHQQLEQLEVERPVADLDATWATFDEHEPEGELDDLAEPEPDDLAEPEAEGGQESEPAERLAEVRQLRAGSAAAETDEVDETTEPLDESAEDQIAEETPSAFDRVRTVETDDWRAMLVSLREEAGSREVVPVKRSGWRIGSPR